MKKRLSVVLGIAVASGLIAAGCGGDDEDEDGNGTTGPADISVVAPTDTATVPEELQEQADEQREQLYEECIASVDQVPEAAREEARESCEALKQ